MGEAKVGWRERVAKGWAGAREGALAWAEKAAESLEGSLKRTQAKADAWRRRRALEVARVGLGALGKPPAWRDDEPDDAIEARWARARLRDGEDPGAWIGRFAAEAGEALALSGEGMEALPSGRAPWRRVARLPLSAPCAWMVANWILDREPRGWRPGVGGRMWRVNGAGARVGKEWWQAFAVVESIPKRAWLVGIARESGAGGRPPWSLRWIPCGTGLWLLAEGAWFVASLPIRCAFSWCSAIGAIGALPGKMRGRMLQGRRLGADSALWAAMLVSGDAGAAAKAAEAWPESGLGAALGLRLERGHPERFEHEALALCSFAAAWLPSRQRHAAAACWFEGACVFFAHRGAWGDGADQPIHAYFAPGAVLGGLCSSDWELACSKASLKAAVDSDSWVEVGEMEGAVAERVARAAFGREDPLVSMMERGSASAARTAAHAAFGALGLSVGRALALGLALGSHRRSKDGFKDVGRFFGAHWNKECAAAAAEGLAAGRERKELTGALEPAEAAPIARKARARL